MIATIGLVILAASSVANLLLGYVVFNKNRAHRANQLFGVLSVALVGWSTAAHYGILGASQLSPDVVFLFLRLVFSFVALQNLAFFLFIAIFPGQRVTINRLFASVITLFGSIMVVLPFSGDFFASYMDTQLMPGPGMMILMLSILFFAIGGLSVLGSKLRHLDIQSKNQARYLMVAAVILWVLVPVVDFILPTFLGLNFSYILSPVVALLFALTIAYAIIRERLFDIRPVVARSASYGLFLITLVVGYVAIAFAISNFFIK